MHFEKRRRVVELALKHTPELEPLEECFDTGELLGDIVECTLIFLIDREFGEFGQRLKVLAHVAQPFDDGHEIRALAGEVLRPVSVVPDIGVGELPLDLF